jgi:hypothetical protein
MKQAIPAAILFLCAASAFALDPPKDIHPRIGIMIIKNAVPTGEVGAPSAITNTLGACVTFPFSNYPKLTFEPGVDVFWTQYGWGTDDRAHLVEIEANESALVVGAILDAPVLWRYDFSPRFWCKLGLGGAVVVRAAFLASGSGASDSEVQDIGFWFYKKLRWFYPDAQVRIAYQLQEKFTFEFTARGFLPLFNVLDSEAPSFWDQGMIDITMGMRIKLD